MQDNGQKTTSGTWSLASSRRAVNKLGKLEETGCKIISGVPLTFTVKGLMVVMMEVSGKFQRGWRTGESGEKWRKPVAMK